MRSIHSLTLAALLGLSQCVGGSCGRKPASVVVRGEPYVDGASPEVSRGLDQDVTDAFLAQHLPGLGIAVVARGQLVYARGYGLANREEHRPVELGTLFRIASITKTLTATAALQLAEQGKLDLDAEIQRYMPSFPRKPWPITARELLGHLSGIRHYRGDEVMSARRYTDLRAPLAIFENDPLEAEPLSKFIYSSYGFNLLGAAMENAGGAPFVSQLQARILIPAGMNDTRAEDAAAPVAMAAGYAWSPAGLTSLAPAFDVSNKLPSGGFLSTATDLARFAIALMHGELLSDTSRALMWTPQKLKDGSATGYGLGWAAGELHGNPTVQHAGAQPGVSTLLWMMPEQGCAVVLLSNLGDASLEPLARKLAERACLR